MPLEQKMGPDKEGSLAGRLSDVLYKRFGEDWARDISLTLRVDRLYWLVYLAELGIATRAQQYKDFPDGSSSVEEAASLVSWIMDLEALVARIQLAITPVKKSRAKGVEPRQAD